ncbi:MAG: hypothetical protein ABEJ40_05385 [Haloarculaceae archaeon]
MDLRRECDARGGPKPGPGTGARANPDPGPRASSTAFDAVLFVLLVGVAVAVLAGAVPGESTGPSRIPDETADVLATSTERVTVERRGAVRADGLLPGERAGTASVSVERSYHGTYAELLAAATVANPRLGTRPLTGVGRDLAREARNVTRRALPTDDANVRVVARWRPYPGASLAGSVTVGDAPPRDADVSVATLTVASGFPNASARLHPERASYAGVAEVVARGVVAGLFPVNRTEDALASEGPDRAITAHRYRTASDALGARTGDALAEADVTAANRRLADRLAPAIERDLVRTFETPAAAARAVSLDRVRIVVRTWSP